MERINPMLLYTDNADLYNDVAKKYIKGNALAGELLTAAAENLKDCKDFTFTTLASGIMNTHPTCDALVIKDAHQDEKVEGAVGLDDHKFHFTVALVKKTNNMQRHDVFNKAYHVYIKVLDPPLGQSAFSLQPCEATYDNSSAAIHAAKSFVSDVVHKGKKLAF
jgi:hypothetical protein